MALITYNDKSDYQSSSLANEYKVSASDMNEIKTVVNNNATTTQQTITDLYSGIDNANTNIIAFKRNNTIHFTGVVYFTSSPGTWSKLLKLPNGYYGTNTHGSLIEESTGLVRPIVIKNNGEVQLTANISSTPLYAYIIGDIII